jgi:hypothetical protein
VTARGKLRGYPLNGEWEGYSCKNMAIVTTVNGTKIAVVLKGKRELPVFPA